MPGAAFSHRSLSTFVRVERAGWFFVNASMRDSEPHSLTVAIYATDVIAYWVLAYLPPVSFIIKSLSHLALLFSGKRLGQVG